MFNHLVKSNFVDDFGHKKTGDFYQSPRPFVYGGEGGIRTHGPFDRTLDFESIIIHLPHNKDFL